MCTSQPSCAVWLPTCTTRCLAMGICGSSLTAVRDMSSRQLSVNKHESCNYHVWLLGGQLSDLHRQQNPNSIGLKGCALPADARCLKLGGSSLCMLRSACRSCASSAEQNIPCSRVCTTMACPTRPSCPASGFSAASVRTGVVNRLLTTCIDVLCDELDVQQGGSSTCRRMRCKKMFLGNVTAAGPGPCSSQFHQAH